MSPIRASVPTGLTGAAGSDGHVACSDRVEGSLEVAGHGVVAGVVGDDFADGDALAEKEQRCASMKLAQVVPVSLLRISAASPVVIDGGVDVVVADPGAADLLAAAVGTPLVAVGDPPDLLQVDVDPVTGVVAFVADRARFDARIASPVSGSHSRRYGTWGRRRIAALRAAPDRPQDRASLARAVACGAA